MRNIYQIKRRGPIQQDRANLHICAYWRHQHQRSRYSHHETPTFGPEPTEGPTHFCKLSNKGAVYMQSNRPPTQ